MAVSILEALQNANYNLTNLQRNPILFVIVKQQLNNAITLLEKGYPLETLVEPLLDTYGQVEDVPEYNSQEENDE